MLSFISNFFKMLNDLVKAGRNATSALELKSQVLIIEASAEHRELLKVSGISQEELNLILPK